MTSAEAAALDHRLEAEIDHLTEDLIARRIVDVDGITRGIEQAIDCARRATLSKMLIAGVDPEEVDVFERALDDALAILQPQMVARAVAIAALDVP